MSESEIMRNQPLSCTALQQSNHPRVNSNIALNSKTRVDARQRKRREDAHALPKLSRNGEKRFHGFRTKCWSREVLRSWSVMRPRIAFGRIQIFRVLSSLPLRQPLWIAHS